MDKSEFDQFKTPYSMYLEIQQIKKLKEISKKTHVTVSVLIREAINQYLKKS